MINNIIIRELSPKEQKPYDLLLLADPSKAMIDCYIEKSKIFVAVFNELVIGVYALLKINSETIEIVNIAVKEDYQRKGIGKLLIEDAINKSNLLEAKILKICTGNSSLSQLSLYQKCGFRITGIHKGFFEKNYPGEIIENGIVCRDKIILSLNL